MKKRIALILTVALFLGICSLSAAAQSLTSAKGTCKDDDGKPIVGATVEFLNLETNRKTVMKTDKHGDYFTMGVMSGKYKVTLTDADGKVLWFFNNRQLAWDPSANEINFDLAKEHAAAAKSQGMTPEEQKRMQEAQAATTKIKGINELLNRASESTKANPPNWEQALAYLQQAADQDNGQHDLVYGRLGEVLAQLDKMPEAEAAYLKAISLAPTKGDWYNNLGQVYVKENKVDDAIAQYTKAAEVDAAHAGTYYFNLGAVLTNKGRVDEAIQAFDKCIAAEPTHAEAYYWKGVNLVGKATTDANNKVVAPPGTEEALKKYLELDPTGKYADGAKGMLDLIGSSVQTQYGTDKKPSKPTGKH